MKIGNKTFRGEQPRLTPRELPENAAQVAINCRMQSGDLEAWRQHLQTKVLANTGPVQTIYLLKDKWLSWNEQVDVARSPIPGDDTYRVFLTCPTLYDTPRFTDYALATTGAEPYPVVTRPLGVPIPTDAPVATPGVDSTPTSFSIDVLDEGNLLATDWTTNPPLIGSRYATVTQDAGNGDPLPCYVCTFDENRDPGQEAWAYRDFGVGGVSVLEVSVDFMLTNRAQACITVGANADGQGISVIYNDGAMTICKRAYWGCIFGISGLTTVAVGPIGGVWNSMRVSVVRKPNGTKTVTASMYDDTDALLGEVVATNTFDDGPMCGFSNGINDDAGSQYITRYDNYHVRAAGSTDYVPVNTATSYLYTFKNDLGQESAPSPTSATVLRPDGVSVTVTTPTTAPVGTDPDYGITTKVIYRAVTGAGGTAFLKVAEIPLAQADYVDVLSDDAVGPGVLETEDYDLPPDTLQGIITLPNGMMAGFFANQFCLSVQNRPHAWPVKYRKTTDTDIVAIANIDNTVVIGTKSFVYTATGNTPDGFSMSKPGAAQSCVSKRGMVFLDNVGVVFPSPDGYQVCAGSAGNVNNLTEQIFTRRQWQALEPQTIIAAAHDSVLHFFYEATAPSGIAIDAKAGGFGLIRLSYHATAVHADPITDNLYLVLDATDEPTDALLPLPSSEVSPTGVTIFQFDGDGSDSMVFRWRGRLNITPYPLHMAIAQARAQGYENLVLRIYADGVLIMAKLLASKREFVVTRHEQTDEYEYELIGTSRARTFYMAEDVTELP